MNQILPIGPPDLRSQDLASPDSLSPIQVIEEMIRVDPITGDLIIQNGKARIVLTQDGTVRVRGRRIVHEADEGFDVLAATIDLN